MAEAMGVAEGRTGRARRFERSDKYACVAHDAGSDMLRRGTQYQKIGVHHAGAVRVSTREAAMPVMPVRRHVFDRRGRGRTGCAQLQFTMAAAQAQQSAAVRRLAALMQRDEDEAEQTRQAALEEERRLQELMRGQMQEQMQQLREEERQRQEEQQARRAAEQERREAVWEARTSEAEEHARKAAEVARAAEEEARKEAADKAFVR